MPSAHDSVDGDGIKWRDSGVAGSTGTTNSKHFVAAIPFRIYEKMKQKGNEILERREEKNIVFIYFFRVHLMAQHMIFLEYIFLYTLFRQCSRVYDERDERTTLRSQVFS